MEPSEEYQELQKIRFDILYSDYLIISKNYPDRFVEILQNKYGVADEQWLLQVLLDDNEEHPHLTKTVGNYK